jgi:hypothetical protein
MALAVIIGLYIGIGILAAAGSIAITSKRLSGKTEQVFYGLLLIPVAAMYLAFTAHFAATDAWRTEVIAVALFIGLGVLGIRLPLFLMLGYGLHGAWDLVHEVFLHEGTAAAGTRTLSEIPLAYGAFCAAYDWCMVGYFYIRRTQWKAAWGR